MAQFSVSHIHCEGEVEGTKFDGTPNSPISNIDPKVEKQDNNTARLLVTSDYKVIVNNKPLFAFKVITTYTLFKIDLNNLEKESGLIPGLVLKAFAHLQGAVAAKYQSKDVPFFHIPDEPDYALPIAKAQREFVSIFRQPTK